MPQYSRKQYSIKQYGKYQSKGKQEFYLTKGDFKRARIRLKLSSGYTVWVYQHTPIHVKGKHEKLRLKSNTGEIIYNQTITFKGNHAVRLRSNLNPNIEETIESQVIITKGGGK